MVFCILLSVLFLTIIRIVLVFIVIWDYGQVFSNSTANYESPERIGMEHENIMPPDGAIAAFSVFLNNIFKTEGKYLIIQSNVFHSLNTYTYLICAWSQHEQGNTLAFNILSSFCCIDLMVSCIALPAIICHFALKKIIWSHGMGCKWDIHWGGTAVSKLHRLVLKGI